MTPQDEQNRAFDRWYWPRALLAMVAVVGVISACLPSKPRLETALVAPAPADALPDATLADGRRLVPSKPEPWQAKPKGNPPKCKRGQHLINGACWYKANPEDFQPPCDAPTFEHKGACFHAIAEPAKSPVSVGQ